MAGELVMTDCAEHGSSRAWIVCTHVSDDGAEPASCKRTPDDPEISGEVLCKRCLGELDVRQALPDESRAALDPPAALRVACEKCVMEKWGKQLLS